MYYVSNLEAHHVEQKVMFPKKITIQKPVLGMEMQYSYTFNENKNHKECH